jgi:hypothetical protein
LRFPCRTREPDAVSPLEEASTQAGGGALRGPFVISGPAHAASVLVARGSTLCYPSPMRLGRRPGLTPLDEAAAYARCHGARDNDVRIVKLPPRRPRYEDVLTTGEALRELFEQRLDARDAESQ